MTTIGGSMSENKPGSIIRGKDSSFFQGLTLRLKLILRLMSDKRVSPILKLIPIGALVYLIFPDLAPGPIDDAAVLWLGTYLFVELCPPDVVAEHMAQLTHGEIPGQFPQAPHPDEDIIDAEYQEH